MSYLSAVLADAPTHYWRLADGGSQVAYDIGSGRYQLAGQGGSGYSGPNSDGGSRWCDGTTNKGVVSAKLLPWGNPFSVEVMFWAFGNPAAAGTLCAWDNTNNPSAALFYQPNRTVTWGLSGSPALASAPTVEQQWHHAVGTWDGLTMRLYVDAIQTNVAFVSGISASRVIGFGEQPIGGGAAFNGALSELALYSSVLSPARVNAHFLALDNAASVPIYAGSGAFNVVTQGFIADAAQLDAVLAAVRKVF